MTLTLNEMVKHLLMSLSNGWFAFKMSYCEQSDDVLLVIEALIERRVEILELLNDDGESPLHYACLHNASVEVFELLMGK